MNKTILFFIAFLIKICFANAQWVNTNCPNSTIYCSTVSGSNLFVGTWRGGIFLLTDTSSNWIAVNTGLTDSIILSLAANDTNIFAGTLHDGVFLSTNNGASWTAVNNGITDMRITSLAFNGTSIFAGTHRSGIFLSTDNGTSWSAVNNGIPYDTLYTLNNHVELIKTSGGNIYASVGGKGVFLSTNNGTNWTAVNSGLTDLKVMSLAISGNKIIAGTCGSGLFSSSNNGTSWTHLNYSYLDTSCILELAAKGTKFFAGANFYVYLSVDTGNSWIIASGNPLGSFTSIVTNETNVFAGTEGNGVWKCPLSQMTEITNMEKNNSVSIFPNPSYDKITIKIATMNNETKIFIYNIQWQIIKTLNNIGIETTIDIGDFSSGFYILKVITDKEIVTKKFIKE